MIVLKISLLVVFFAGYTIAQYFLHDWFFNKASFTLRFLTYIYRRNPYITSIFNSYRAEIIENGYLGNSDYGKHCFIR